MNRLLFGAALVLAIGGLAFAGTSTPELVVTTDGITTGILVGSAGSVSFSSANFGGWDLTVVAGASNSPSITPFGIDIANLSSGCVGGGTCASLTIELSDINFNVASPTLMNNYSATDSGTASTSQTAWWGANTYFDTTHSLGTVGPFDGAGTFAGSSSGAGPGAGSIPYSLTIEQVFAGCTGAGCVSYSSDGSITGVPEPGSIALLGGALLFCASRLRRRKA